MKSPSINNYLETLTNPGGRFKTLTDLEVVKEADGRPRYAVTSETLDFSVNCGGRLWQLRCFRRDQSKALLGTHARITYLQERSTPEIVRSKWLLNEMLVFNEQDESGYYDVMLSEIPAGITLGAFLYETAHRGDRVALTSHFKRFAALAARLVRENAWSHNNIQPRNIIVTPAGDFRMTDYRRVTIPSMENWEQTRYTDYLSLAILALMLYVIAQNPALGSRKNMDHVSYYPAVKKVIIDLVEVQIDRLKAEEFRALYQLVRDNEVIRDGELLAGVIERLGEANPALPIQALHEEKVVLPSPLYEQVAPFREGLAAAVSDGKYGYIDREGSVVIPFRYDWADGFEEGLAVVKSGNRFGVINKKGTEVFPPQHEDVRWRADNGVVLLCIEGGQWCLMSREGARIGEQTFDLIFDYSCDLASVRREGKYGYIDRKGELVIPLVYDEAYSFSEEGLATVSKNGQVFCIDTDGMVFD